MINYKGKASGGPQTPKGKAASAKNALTHAAYASPAITLSDAAAKADFDAFSEALLQDLAPQGSTQELVAQHIVAEAWRMRHLTAYEQRGLDGIAQYQPSARELHDELGLNWPDDAIHLLHMPLKELAKLVEADPLLALQRDLIKYRQTNFFGNLKSANPALYQRMLTLRQLELSFAYDENGTHNLLLHIDYIGLSLLPKLLASKALPLAQSREWIVQNQQTIEQARARCVARRMLESISSPNLLRARTTINKTLFALLAEYRKLQQQDTIAAPTPIEKA